MAVFTAGTSGFQSVMQLVGIIAVFIIILIFTYYATKWIGASGMAGGRSRNIKVIESCRVGQNAFIHIIKAGEKYLCVSVTKERIEYLTELRPDEIVMDEPNAGQAADFKDILAGLRDKHRKKGQ